MEKFRELKNLGAFLLVFSIFSSAGGHLFALQSVAWASMLWKNIQNDSTAAAVKKTFDGKHPCGRCHEIAAEQVKKSSIPAHEIERRFDPFDLPSVHFELKEQSAGTVRWYSFSSRLLSLVSVPPTPPPKHNFFSLIA